NISDPLIRTKIYSLIAQQIETSMMAEVKENFAFKIIDPPRAPDKRIKPNRSRRVMISFMVSLFAGIFIAFLREYIEKAKSGKQ
ncbi:MAG TPA: GNVR domain-containing protein, partial [Thermodesulfovibrionia bacterium]|nr:GNVR domain-containing protein [Thermodesulfovibrionia bacterium]